MQQAAKLALRAGPPADLPAPLTEAEDNRNSQFSNRNCQLRLRHREQHNRRNTFRHTPRLPAPTAYAFCAGSSIASAPSRGRAMVISCLSVSVSGFGGGCGMFPDVSGSAANDHEGDTVISAESNTSKITVQILRNGS